MMEPKLEKHWYSGQCTPDEKGVHHETSSVKIFEWVEKRAEKDLRPAIAKSE